MKFEVSRSSHKEPPCKNAVQEEALLDVLGTEGIPQTVWTIEIDSIPELIEFCRQNGQIIVNKTSGFLSVDEKAEICKIEIYDDNRE